MAKTQKKKKSRREMSRRTSRQKVQTSRNDLDKIVWDRIGPLTVDVK